MMISPRSFTGAKSADLAPTTISTAPSFILFHSSYLSPSESPLWRIATLPGNMAVRYLTGQRVKDISGTNSMAFLPRSTASSIAFRYTRVFPLPVTP